MPSKFPNPSKWLFTRLNDSVVLLKLIKIAGSVVVPLESPLRVQFEMVTDSAILKAVKKLESLELLMLNVQLRFATLTDCTAWKVKTRELGREATGA